MSKCPDLHSPSTLHRAHSRAGVVLIIVVGLAMVLLGLSVSFLIRMRSDSEEVQSVTATAQARIMLTAALMYLQEGSRLGWASGATALTRGSQTFGWTDVRDGSLGPRQNRNYPNKTKYDGAATSTPVDGSIDGITGQPVPIDGYNIPVPVWWDAAWPQYRAIPDESNPLEFPVSAQRRWPCPGAVVRCPMALPVQPPYATEIRLNYNPVMQPPGTPSYGQPNFDTPWQTALTRSNPNTGTPIYGDWPSGLLTSIFNPQNGSEGMLDPQPQANVWFDASYTGAPGQTPDFVSGAIQPGVTTGDWTHFVDTGVGNPHQVQLAVVDGTDNICWFRIYREVQTDHDNSGFPDYNRVALYDPNYPHLRNWNVFVIACGCGATRGYRFWDESDIDSWESLHSVPAGTVSRGQDLASNSPLFQSMGEAGFKNLLTASKVLWYRVEWSALQGGGFNNDQYSWGGVNRLFEMGTTTFPGWNYPKNLGLGTPALLNNQVEGGYASQLMKFNSIKSYGGNFKWVQALDREPPNW